MNADQEFEIRMKAEIYAAILKLMEANYNWWITAPSEFVVQAVMKETKGRYSPDVVRECLKGTRHGHQSGE